MLKGGIELAIHAILDEQPREAQNGDEEPLARGRELVDLQFLQVIVAAGLFEDVVKAVQGGHPVEEVTTGPAPLGDAVHHSGELLIVCSLYALNQAFNFRALSSW